MAKTRSYAKESFKSDPSGIRFNLVQEKIALIRSGKKTRQQLIDFLLENYVKGENPVVERNGVTNNIPNDKAEYTPPPPEPQKTPIEWVKEKREIESPEQYQEFIKKLTAVKYLSDKQKTEIKFA